MSIFAVWDADSHGSEGKLNKEIFELLGHNMEFDGSTRHDSCHAGKNYLCFSLDACLLFKVHLGFESFEPNENTKEEIKKTITTYGAWSQSLTPRGSGTRTLWPTLCPRYATAFLAQSRY